MLLGLTLVYDLIGEELLQALAKLSFLDGGNFLYSSRSRGESVEGLELQAVWHEYA